MEPRQEGELFGSQKNNKLINEIVPTEQRRMTDVCCLLLALLFTTVIVAVPLHNKNDLTVRQLILPSDSDGKVCGVDYPEHPFIYFADPNDMSKRVCVGSCPSSASGSFSCKSTSAVSCSFSGSLQFLSTNPKQTLNGKFCMPEDPSALTSLKKEHQLSNRYFFFMDYKQHYLRAAMSAAIALLILVLLMFCPGFTLYLVMFFSLLSILALASVFYVYHTETITEKIILAGILGVILIFSVLQLLVYRQSIRFTKIFFSQTKNFMLPHFYMVLYIFFFTAILAAFLFFLFILYSYGLSYRPASFDSTTSLYYVPDKTTFIVVISFVGVYLIWGFGCIHQTFSIIVTTHVLSSIFKPEGECGSFCLALKLVFTHLGSIIASAFLNFFFFLPAVLYGDIRSCMGAKFYRSGCCGQVLDLVRGDALAYIALTGNPYCNSAKYCEYLWYESMTTENIKSSLIVFKISAMVLVATSSAVASLFALGVIPSSFIYFDLVLAVLITSIFTLMHTQACETIRMVYLMEQESYRRRQELMKYTANSLNRADQLKFLKEAEFMYSNKEVGKQIVSLRQEYWKIEIQPNEEPVRKVIKKHKNKKG